MRLRTNERRPGWTYLQPACYSTQQDKWDDQIRLNRAHVADRRRWLPLARWIDSVLHSGLERRIIRDTACPLAIADRMESCPNNPRNGGDGHDHGQGWTDRRAEYVAQSDYLVVRYPIDNRDGWTVELLENTPQAHAELRRLRNKFAYNGVSITEES